MRLILSATAACLLASQANANGCRVQKVVQEVAVAVPVVPVIQAVTIPLYNYSYAPPVYAPPPQPVYQQPQQPVYQPPAQNYTTPPQNYTQPQAIAEPPQDCCQALVAELAKLRAEIAALRGAPPIAGVPPLQQPPAALPPPVNGGPVMGSVLSNRCAACHGAVNPKGEFSLYLADGKRAPLSIQQKARAKRMIVAGHMPPPLTAAEQAAGVQRPPLVPGEKEAAMKEIDQP